MTDTSKSEASRFFVEGKNLHTDPKTGSVEYVETINHLLYALLDSGTAQHKGVRLTFARVPKDTEIERGDMPVFLQLLLESNSALKVCALDMSLPRNAEGWFRRRDQDKGPRVFKHIRKLYIRFPKEPEDRSPNEPEDQSPDEPEDQSPNEPKDQSPKVSLEQVTQLLKDSLAPDNRFPNLIELRIFGLDEDSVRKAEADASIGRRLFMVLISGPEAYYSARLESLCRKVEPGPVGESITYHVVMHREGEDGLLIQWEPEKETPNELLHQVPESSTGSPP